MNHPAEAAMPVVTVLELLANVFSGDQIVVTNQGSSRIWPTLRRRALDFHYNPSTMGGAIPLALGLALAQPQREVLAVSGDGSLLMSLGTLVTVVGSRAANLTIALLDNGQYEVTGGQQTAGAVANVDYAGMARAAGFRSVAEYRNLDQWQRQALGILLEPGPRFIRLVVGKSPSGSLLYSTPSVAQQQSELRAALGHG